MILDQLNNASLYFHMHPGLEKGLRFLQEMDFTHCEPGTRYEIDGSDIYAVVQEFMTRPKEAGSWESHRKYVDIHYLVDGQELLGYASLCNMQAVNYDEGKDFQVLAGQGDFFTACPGTFAVFMPEDVHMPGMAVEAPDLIRKVLVKVAV